MRLFNYLLRTILFLIIFISCKQRKDTSQNKETIAITWTELQKRKYFQDSIAYRMYNGNFGTVDSLNNFQIFSKIFFPNINLENRNNACIYALEEPLVDTTSIDTSKIWLRITVDHTFRKPYCLILEKKQYKNYLTYKTTDGHGGYFSGLLNFSFTKVITDSIFENTFKKIREINFWELRNDTTCIGLDGEGWTIEAIKKGKYNFIERWTPFYCGNPTTRKIGEIGVDLRKLIIKMGEAEIKK